MNIPIFIKLTRAIHDRHVVALTDQAGRRKVEVYLIFESQQGELLLHGWQREGAYGRKPPPKWINLRLDDLRSLEISKERFVQPHVGYNPRAANFQHVVYELDHGQHGAPTSVKQLRAHTLKRRSPPPGGMVARRNGGGGKRRQRSS